MKTKTTWLAVPVAAALALIAAWALFITWLTVWGPASLPDAKWFSSHLPAGKAAVSAHFIRMAPWLSLILLVIPVVVGLKDRWVQPRTARVLNIVAVLVLIGVSMVLAQLRFWAMCPWSHFDHNQWHLWW
jgi:hypothetical protein